MNTPDWIQYFERNLRSFTDPRMEAGTSPLPAKIQQPLAESLSVFQLGESGGGTRLLRYVREALRDRPEELAGYDLAVSLFVAEEQRHADLLEKLVTYLNGSLLKKHWTNSIFRKVRTLLGMEFNIQILLTAELIAEVYYGVLYRRVPDPVVKTCCHKILRDEMRHIAFHQCFFQEHLKRLPQLLRRFWISRFIFCHEMTSLVVAWDHHRLLQAIGMTKEEFLKLARKARGRFLRHLASSEQPCPPGVYSHHHRKAAQLAPTG